LAGLIVSGNTLYGTTGGPALESGMAGGVGSVFAVNINGSNFTNLYSFVYSDGVMPQARLILSGNTLFGTASAGGVGGNGIVFKVNSDGTDYTVLKSFSPL